MSTSTNEPRLPARIVLTGFMGSGKSTVGRLLAAALGRPFHDLDTVIEEREGMTVPQIFAQRGEPAFRDAEAAALAELLLLEDVVIALGGGAVETETNRARLARTPSIAIVFLDAPLLVLTGRCDAQAADPSATARPLLADPAAAEARLASRRPIYLSVAHHTVATGPLTPEAVCAAVAALL